MVLWHRGMSWDDYRIDFRPYNSIIFACKPTQKFYFWFRRNPLMDKLLLAEQLRPVLGSEILENMQNGRSWSLPSTPKPQNYAGNELLALFFPPRKNTIFSWKSRKSNILGIFRLLKARIFAIWATRRCVRTYHVSPRGWTMPGWGYRGSKHFVIYFENFEYFKRGFDGFEVILYILETFSQDFQKYL